MKLAQSILLVFLALSCSKDDISIIPPDDTGLVKNQTITISGVTRSYHLYIPQNTVNAPLVILLHGHGGSSDQSIGEGLGKSPQKVWLSLAENENILLAIPNGEIGSSDTLGWNDCRNDAPANPDTDDVQFIDALTDKLKDEFNFNENRVYVAGVSNGASMAIRLAQEIPNKITAFASIVATIPENSECLNGNIPVSALFMNGTADPIAPYEGGQMASNRGLVKSTDESISYWVSRNNTETTPTETLLNDVDTSDSSTVEKYTYANGTNGTEVVLYKVIGGGHTEPSILEQYGNLYLGIVGNQNRDIEMATEVWEFFKNK